MSELYPWTAISGDFAVGRSADGVYISTVMDTIDMAPGTAWELGHQLIELAEEFEADG